MNFADNALMQLEVSQSSFFSSSKNMHLNASVGECYVCSGAGCLSNQKLKVSPVVIRVEDPDLRIIKFMINEYRARRLGKKISRTFVALVRILVAKLSYK